MKGSIGPDASVIPDQNFHNFGVSWFVDDFMMSETSIGRIKDKLNFFEFEFEFELYFWLCTHYTMYKSIKANADI